MASSQKNKGKWTHQDAFVDENKSKAMVIAGLAAEKHAHKMAEHKQCMAELEIKKQWLALDVKGKHLEAGECRIAAQHQRDREREQHNMQMLCLRLQYQQGVSESSGISGISGISGVDTTAQFGMEQGGLRSLGLAADGGQFGTEHHEQYAGSNTFGYLGIGLDGTYLT